MKITQRTEVYRKKTGDLWLLWPTEFPETFWLSPNDGMVPSGQYISDTMAEELFSLTPIENIPVNS